jgi:hypothetical protein
VIPRTEKKDLVGEVRLDAADRLGADEGAGELAQRAARHDDLDLRGVDLADELDDRHRVRQQGAAQVLAHDAARDEVRRRRAVDEQRLPRLDEFECGLRQALLRLDRDLEALEERVLVA